MVKSESPTGVQEAGSEQELDQRVVKASAWVALSFGGSSVLQVVSMLALVHLLDPKAFGLVALASTLLAVVEHVQSAGMGAALVYRRDSYEPAASSAFVFSGLSGLVLGGACAALAPVFAWAVHSPGVTDVLRALAALLALRGLAVVPAAILERELDFKGRAKAELSAGAVQVGVSIALALAGAGVWSLVGGQLAGAAVGLVVAWLLVRWRPDRRHVSLAAIRELGGYGRHVSAGNILGVVNSTVDNITVARVLGTTALGFYAIVFRIADYPTAVIGYVVSRVMFSAYSAVRGDRDAFRRAFALTLQRVALFALPTTVMLIVAAKPIVLGLLGQRWLPTVVPLQILAGYGVVRLFASVCGAVFQAAGKPQLVPLLALPHGIVVIPALVLLVPPFGLKGAATAMVVAFAASGLPAFVMGLRLLGIGGRELLRLLGPLLLCSGILAATLAALEPATGRLSPVPGLVLLLLGGTAVYVVAVAVLARRTVEPLLVVVRPRLAALLRG